jgi:hypothetical protein
MRAIWSAPPPVPAGITISTGLVGSHAIAGLMPKPAAVTAKAVVNTVRLNEWFINAPPEEWNANVILAFYIQHYEDDF